MTSAQAALAATAAEALMKQADRAQEQGDECAASGKTHSALAHYQSTVLLLHLSMALNALGKALEPDAEPTPDGPHLTDEEGWRDQQRERRAE